MPTRLTGPFCISLSSQERYVVSHIQILDMGYTGSVIALAPVDVLVLLKIIAQRERPWTQPEIASSLLISQSIVSRALKTADSLALYRPTAKRVNVKALEDALSHGARYFLGATKGGDVRGMPTAWAAPPLAQEIATSEPLPPVWPDPTGSVRGLSVEPLHPNVPKAARNDPELYELLALLDVFRIGGAREVAIAGKAFHERLNL